MRPRPGTECLGRHFSVFVENTRYQNPAGTIGREETPRMAFKTAFKIIVLDHMMPHDAYRDVLV